MLEGMTFFWNIFDKSLHFRAISFKSKFSILLFCVTVIFIHFYNVFVLDSLKISSVLNFCCRARSHIVLEYNNANMRFICLLLANQIAYFFALMISSFNITIFNFVKIFFNIHYKGTYFFENLFLRN